MSQPLSIQVASGVAISHFALGKSGPGNKLATYLLHIDTSVGSITLTRSLWEEKGKTVARDNWRAVVNKGSRKTIHVTTTVDPEFLDEEIAAATKLFEAAMRLEAVKINQVKAEVTSE